MKVAIVINTSWNIYNFREGLVKHFLQRGDEVIALAPYDSYSDEIKKWGVKYIETPIDQTGSNPIKDFQYFNNLRKIFKVEKPDVALCYTIKSNIYSTLAGKLVGVPTICNVSGLGTVFLVEGLTGKIAMMLYSIAFRFSKKIFFQNVDDKDLFLSEITSVDESNTGLLPGSGVNLKKFSFINMKENGITKFLMVSRVIEEKGVRDFYEAAKLVIEAGYKAEFLLIGGHDEEHARSIPTKELDEWIKSGIIKYEPHDPNVSRRMEESDVIVLPSYREGTPRTLLEGASIGRALLATDVPGCKEVISDGVNGFLFKVKNPESLAGKIKLYLALSREERVRMSRASRKLVEELFDEKIVIERYVEAIDEIVDN